MRNVTKLEIGILVIVFVAAGALYYTGNVPSVDDIESSVSQVTTGSESPAPSDTESPSDTETVTGDEGEADVIVIPAAEVSSEISSFIETQRNEDGFYNSSSNCPYDAAGCPMSDFIPQLNMWTSLAYLSEYQRTGDSSFLDKSKNDADLFIDWCNESDSNSQQCPWTLVQMNYLYEETRDDKYKDFILSQSEHIEQDIVADPMLMGIEAREFAIVHELTGSQDSLDTSLRKMSNANDLLDNGFIGYAADGFFYHPFDCWTQLANVELYRSTGDQSYLEEAEVFVSDAKMRLNHIFLSEMTDIQPCIDLHLQLYDETGNEDYLNTAKKMSNFVLVNFWDSNENFLKEGRGAVLHHENDQIDSLTDGAYMVFLMNRMGEIDQ